MPMFTSKALLKCKALALKCRTLARCPTLQMNTTLVKCRTPMFTSKAPVLKCRTLARCPTLLGSKAQKWITPARCDALLE